MCEQERQAPSGKQIFQRGLLRENPVLMQCIGLFPAIALATSLKSAAIVAVASAVLLLVMEFLTALLLKKLPFWLRIGMYALLGFGILAGGLAACEKLFPNLIGSLSSYLLLLAVNALTVFRCETCAAHQSVRVSVLDALGASLGYAAVLVLLGFFRELLGSGAVLGHVFPALPNITGMLMPFGGFLLLGFMAAAVKWLYDKRHSGEDELETPVAHVDEDDVSVLEPLIRTLRKDRSAELADSAPKAEGRPEQKKHAKEAAQGKPARPEKHSQQKASEKRAREERRSEHKAAEKRAREEKRLEEEAAAKRAREEKRRTLETKRLEKEAAAKQAQEENQQPPAAEQMPKKKKPESEQKRQPPAKKRQSGERKSAPAPLPPSPPAESRNDGMESFADVLAALNRRRAEQERTEQGAAGRPEKQKGEEQP